MNDFTFDEENHIYRLGGVPVVSITQVLELTGWVDKTWFTEESRIRGTAVHLACQFLNEGTLDKDSVSPAILGYVEAYEKFLEDYKIELIKFEHRIVSTLYMFAGTLDIAARTKTGLAIIDIKTGEPGESAKLQTAAQGILAREQIPGFDSEPFDRFALRLSKTGKYSLIQHDDVTDLKFFMDSLAAVQRRRNSGELNLERWIKNANNRNR